MLLLLFLIIEYIREPGRFTNSLERENEESVPFQSRLEDPSDQSEKEDAG